MNFYNHHKFYCGENLHNQVRRQYDLNLLGQNVLPEILEHIAPVSDSSHRTMRIAKYHRHLEVNFNYFYLERSYTFDCQKD